MLARFASFLSGNTLYFLCCINLLPICGRLWTEKNAVVLFGKIKFLINFSFHSSER